MKKCLLLVIAVSMTACVTRGPIQTGADTYMMTKTSPACGFRSASGTKATLYKKASRFCKEQGKVPETVTMTGKDGIIFVRCASAELEFRCIEP